MHINTTSIGRFLSFVVLLSLGFTFGTANAADPTVVATWQGGIHFLPGVATKSGNIEEISFKDETPEQWARRITQDVVKPGAKVPAVIYVHGCKGPTAATTWAAPFINDFGFAFFAPDSFKRPGRVPLCYVPGTAFHKYKMRREEIRYARQQISKMDWIDQNRIVLVGKSEGGGAVSDFNDEGYIAYIIMANDCKNTGGSPVAPSGIAVLNLVGANDPKEELCSISREIGGSKAVSVPGQGHQFEGVPEAVAEVAKFLASCCGYKPVSATSNLNEEATAKKLFEELGGMATLDALMKAEEAMGKGDENGQKFWMRVHDITLKFSGG